MKVSWHGNRKHISAHWHTKGLPVLHVAFLRERIQRGFKCYHDLTHKISQLWLTRLLNFHFFMRPCLSCFSLFLHRIWSIESTFLLHTFQCVFSTLVISELSERFPKTLIKLIPVSHFLSTSGCPRLCRYHFSSSCRRRWSINWKAVRAHLSFFPPFDLRWGNSTGCYCEDLQRCCHCRTHLMLEVQEKSTKHKEVHKKKIIQSLFSAIDSSIHTTNTVLREKKWHKTKQRKTLKQTIICRKANTVKRSCPETFVVRTFTTKRASEQVNRQDPVYHFMFSLCRGVWSFSPVYPTVSQTQCSVSQLQRPISDRFGGGKDQIFISKTQNGNLNEIQWK